jgi:putative methionine-R-sulfoxide reductase with GAF domain
MSAKGDSYRGVVDAIDRMVNRGDEADRVLRTVVELLHGRLGHVSWVGISLVEGDRLVLGPAQGLPASDRTTHSETAVPISYDGRVVGEIALESGRPGAFDDEDGRYLGRIATLISQHALVAWDTGGEAWSP